jgi:hypothetical protein
LSPTGSNTNSGTTASAPWKTFARAWQTLLPGDTLLLLDGTYTADANGAVQPNVRNGQPGKPITIKAANDGKAIVDGQKKVVPVKLGDNWGNGGPYGSWYVLEGIVARSGLDQVVQVRGDNNVVRRVSAYDGDTNDNTVLFQIMGDNNLIEDVVAAGTGRYMFNIFDAQGSTLRRAFAMWGSWDGRAFCGVTWPNGNQIGIYNSSHTTVENAIAYGRALTGIFIQANDDNAAAIDNQILGSMALAQGRDYDGSVWRYGSAVWPPTARPGPTADRWNGSSCPDNVTIMGPNMRTGFELWGQGTVEDNVYRDVLATANVGYGFSVARPYGAGGVRTVIDHATVAGNGGGNLLLDGSDVSITNSRIGGTVYANQGEGARFAYRYVNRQLTTTPLFPWPMEGRIQAELGISVKAVAEWGIDTANGKTAIPPAPSK